MLAEPVVDQGHVLRAAGAPLPEVVGAGGPVQDDACGCLFGGVVVVVVIVRSRIEQHTHTPQPKATLITSQSSRAMGSFLSRSPAAVWSV